MYPFANDGHTALGVLLPQHYHLMLQEAPFVRRASVSLFSAVVSSVQLLSYLSCHLIFLRVVVIVRFSSMATSHTILRYRRSEPTTFHDGSGRLRTVLCLD